MDIAGGAEAGYCITVGRGRFTGRGMRYCDGLRREGGRWSGGGRKASG